jgi:plasmid stabilization system protein ParE
VIRPLPVKVSDNAQAQIEQAAAWWAKNRPAAPGAIREELDRILGFLAVQPGMGAPARATKLHGVRRVTLSRIRYYVYYRATDEALEVVAFWHTSRGVMPPL